MPVPSCYLAASGGEAPFKAQLCSKTRGLPHFQRDQRLAPKLATRGAPGERRRSPSAPCGGGGGGFARARGPCDRRGANGGSPRGCEGERGAGGAPPGAGRGRGQPSGAGPAPGLPTGGTARGTGEGKAGERGGAGAAAGKMGHKGGKPERKDEGREGFGLPAGSPTPRLLQGAASGARDLPAPEGRCAHGGRGVCGCVCAKT